MKKSQIVALSVAIFIIFGASIVVWSLHRSGTPIPLLSSLATKSATEKISKHVKNFTDDNFEIDVIEASRSTPVLVDFYADWCFPCRMLDPIMEELATELKGRAVIGKIDTDKNLIARRFGITKIPAIFVLKDGEIKGSFFGVVPKETLIKALKEFGA
jgi:thioredoxin